MITTHELQNDKLVEVKTTANKLAKKLLVDAMESAFYFQEQIDCSKMTDKEIEELKDQLYKRYLGVKKYLNA